jgi:hypothetical protein
MRVTGALPEPDGSLTGVRIGYDAEAAFPLGRGASGAARVRLGRVLSRVAPPPRSSADKPVLLHVAVGRTSCPSLPRKAATEFRAIFHLFGRLSRCDAAYSARGHDRLS